MNIFCELKLAIQVLQQVQESKQVYIDGLLQQQTLVDCTMASKCRKFVPNIFNKLKCQTCFGSKEQHSAEALENNKVTFPNKFRILIIKAPPTSKHNTLNLLTQNSTYITFVNLFCIDISEIKQALVLKVSGQDDANP